VTDADVLLGRIDADNFAGGRIKLDRKASAEAAANSVGKALKIGPEIAAYGIAEIVDEDMASAARVHAIESGKDVTGYTMIAFGGAAPLHVGRIAEKLNIARFIVPSGAGVGSTLGFLRAPVAYEIVRSFPAMLDAFDIAAVNRTLNEMRDEAREVVAKAALGGKLVEQRLAFMRYVGQGHEISVPLPARTLRASDVAELRKAFDKLYGQIYSRSIPDRAVELLTWALTVGTETRKVSVVRDPRGGRTAKPDGQRQIFDPAKEDWIRVPVYERDHLSKGDMVKGPAVIVERETSTFLPKGYDAVINGLGYIDCRRVAASARIGGRA
jgi:N-methylhydantoinase A